MTTADPAVRSLWIRLTAPPAGKRGFALAAVAGAVAGLGQAPWDMPVATVLSLGLLLVWLVRAASPRRAFLSGWGFGVGYFGLTLHWIVFPFLVEPEIHGWMAPFAVVLMAAGLALFWGGAGYVGKRWLGGGATAAAIALTLAEVARSTLFTGFPWVLLGHVWIDTAAARISALVGPYGLTYLTATLATAVALAVLRRRWLDILPVVAVFAVLPLLKAPAAPDVADAGRPTIRLVQPNIPQAEKWDPDRAREHYARLIAATGAAVAPDLVVWPETALPYLLEFAEEPLRQTADAARGAPVVLGINRAETGRYYNSLIVVDAAGQVAATYDKRHLVPFGEYVPLGEVAARFGIQGLAQSQGTGFSAGTGAPHLTLPDGTSILPLICYEGIFAGQVARDVGAERPDMLVLITNDGWFGPVAGPAQHLAQARLRAIETGLPMVRVANTGISALIDPAGRVVRALGMDVDGWFDVPLPAATAAPPYLRWGDWPILLLLGLGGLGHFITRPRKGIDPQAGAH